MAKNPCLDCRIENAKRVVLRNSTLDASRTRIVKYAPLGQQAMVVAIDNEKARAKSVPCEKHKRKAESEGNANV